MTRKIYALFLCDKSKAFDSVWHQGLLYKLDCIDSTGNILKWFQSYMDNRQQQVVIVWFKLRVGISTILSAWGSVLGPLWLLLRKLSQTSSFLEICRFLHHCMYVTIDGDAEDATEQLNNDLLKVMISQWAENWLVRFYANKSKALSVTL